MSIEQKPAKSFEYYRGDIYWNNFNMIMDRINSLIGGGPSIDWQQYFKKIYGSFNIAFFPSCGNGWVERSMHKVGIINKAVGFDINNEMLQQAQQLALEEGLAAKYVLGNINEVNLCNNSFDLIVNHAAMHHVAYINRVTKQLAKSLTNKGIYVGFDYVGPHRNQYTWETWSTMIELNSTLPEKYRVNLTYPHLKTMLHTDPTEAVHSELQLEVLQRYFDIEKYTPLGGGVAYQLLYQNRALYEDQHTPEGRKILQQIIETDEKCLNSGMLGCNLFGFWIARPRADLTDNDLSTAWQLEEDERESAAVKSEGRYYPASALEIIYNEISELKMKLSI